MEQAMELYKTEIFSDFFELLLTPQGVPYIRFTQGTELDENKLLPLFTRLVDVFENKRFPVIVDVSLCKSVDHGAVFCLKTFQLFRAAAFVDKTERFMEILNTDPLDYFIKGLVMISLLKEWMQ